MDVRWMLRVSIIMHLLTFVMLSGCQRDAGDGQMEGTSGFLRVGGGKISQERLRWATTIHDLAVKIVDATVPDTTPNRYVEVSGFARLGTNECMAAPYTASLVTERSIDGDIAFKAYKVMAVGAAHARLNGPPLETYPESESNLDGWCTTHYMPVDAPFTKRVALDVGRDQEMVFENVEEFGATKRLSEITNQGS